MRVVVYYAGIDKKRSSSSIAKIITGDPELQDRFKSLSSLELPEPNSERVEHQPVLELIKEVFDHRDLQSEIMTSKIRYYLLATAEASRFLGRIEDDNSKLTLVSNFGLPRLETGIWLSEKSRQAELRQKLRQAATRLFEHKADTFLLLGSATDSRNIFRHLICSLPDSDGQLPWATECSPIYVNEDVGAAKIAAGYIGALHSRS